MMSKYITALPNIKHSPVLKFTNIPVCPRLQPELFIVRIHNTHLCKCPIQVAMHSPDLLGSTCDILIAMVNYPATS